MANVPQAYSSTAPEVCNSTAPEVNYSTDPEAYYPPRYPELSGAQISYFKSPPGKICGLKRKTFWIALIGMAVVIVAGVGGVLTNSKNKGVLSGSQTSNNSPTPTSTATSSSTATSKAQPMAGSNYAIVNWNTTFAIFYQDNDAMIRMVRFDFTLESGNILNYTWSKPTGPLIPDRSIRNGTSISAISFFKGTTRQARVYLTNTDNVLEEWGWNSVAKKWVTNLIGPVTTVSPNSQVTATILNSATAFHIFVFYQDPGGRLAGVVYTPGVKWVTALTFSDTGAADWPQLNNLGSGLVAVNYPYAVPTGVRIYYQDADNKLNWFQGKDTNLAAAKQSWANGTQLEVLPGNAPLSAIVVPTLNDRILQLFHIQNGNLVVDIFNSSGIASNGVYETPGYLGSGGIEASGPGVATIMWGNGMVLVVTGEKNWFSIWRYEPWNGEWSNMRVPTGYFDTR